MSASKTAPKLPIEMVGGTVDSYDTTELKELIKQNVKMVILINVSATSGGDDHKLNISVSYEIDFLRTKDQLDLLLEY